MNDIRLLFINDKLDIIKSLEARFYRQYRNMHFEYAQNNEEALDKLNSYHYDVIIYDLGMDRDLNYTIAERFKDLKPGAILLGTSGFTRFHNLPKFFDDTIQLDNIVVDNKFMSLLEKYGITLERK